MARSALLDYRRAYTLPIEVHSLSRARRLQLFGNKDDDEQRHYMEQENDDEQQYDDGQYDDGKQHYYGE